jgi:hypothetical protein
MFSVSRRIGHQPLQRQVNGARGEERDEQREGQDAPGEVDHRHAHRRLVQQDLHRHAVLLGRTADDAQHAVLAFAQRHERIGEQANERRGAQIVDGIRIRRHVPGQDTPHFARLGDDDRERPGMVEQLGLELLAHHVVRRRFQGQRRQMCRGDAAVQVVLAEAGDRRRIDQHLADHDEDDRQHQQPGRQAVDASRQLWRGFHAMRLYHPDLRCRHYAPV